MNSPLDRAAPGEFGHNGRFGRADNITCRDWRLFRSSSLDAFSASQLDLVPKLTTSCSGALPRWPQIPGFFAWGAKFDPACRQSAASSAQT
ncbi:hypothetical protein HYPDE_37683 [Hyphomicrobium denitrificans 1NES1]|uniref:Uncharacterized protein n=1 Tax=Hyphomicrobium denitrificans 1NES1 TaxID=670307 RepID=N0B856_9HYPH|nr:hypothetical protein HYPDE_37683 [Hyphomicrobium denitrificans 1NES1]